MSSYMIEKTSIQPVFEDRPAPWRIGLIALSTDHTTEPDLVNMRPSDEVAIYVNRIPYANPGTPENLRRTQPFLTEAAKEILPNEPLDAIMYACTSASALIGDDEVRHSLQLAKPDTPCVTPTSGALAAFKALGVSRISVLAPYSYEVSKALAGYFSRYDLDILNVRYLDIHDDREIARLLPKAIVEASLETIASDSQGLFLACTAMRSVAVIQTIEDQIGKPVVSSNQSMYWHALRSAGFKKNIDGYGRLWHI
jgi:maleate isomerase